MVAESRPGSAAAGGGELIQDKDARRSVIQFRALPDGGRAFLRLEVAVVVNRCETDTKSL